ncbi:MAG: hypothetical protein R2875_12580 [Desulfobacterales bacterium]
MIRGRGPVLGDVTDQKCRDAGSFRHDHEFHGGSLTWLTPPGADVDSGLNMV